MTQPNETDRFLRFLHATGDSISSLLKCPTRVKRRGAELTWLHDGCLDWLQVIWYHGLVPVPRIHVCHYWEPNRTHGWTRDLRARGIPTDRVPSHAKQLELELTVALFELDVISPWLARLIATRVGAVPGPLPPPPVDLEPRWGGDLMRTRYVWTADAALEYQAPIQYHART